MWSILLPAIDFKHNSCRHPDKLWRSLEVKEIFHNCPSFLCKINSMIAKWALLTETLPWWWTTPPVLWACIIIKYMWMKAEAGDEWESFCFNTFILGIGSDPTVLQNTWWSKCLFKLFLFLSHLGLELEKELQILFYVFQGRHWEWCCMQCFSR